MVGKTTIDLSPTLGRNFSEGAARLNNDTYIECLISIHLGACSPRAVGTG